MLAYTKNLAAYTKLSSENQQVKLQCMQCMQKLKIKIVKGEHFLCPPFGYKMMWKLFFLIGWCGIRHQTQQQFEYMLIALGIDTTEMLNCPIPKRWPLVIDKDTAISHLWLTIGIYTFLFSSSIYWSTQNPFSEFDCKIMKKILYLQEGATNPIQNETCCKKMTLLSVWLLILFFSQEDTAIVRN